jgi:hypothetical protein
MDQRFYLEFFGSSVARLLSAWRAESAAIDWPAKVSEMPMQIISRDPPMPDSFRRLSPVAWHEAGHATIARALGLGVPRASASADDPHVVTLRVGASTQFTETVKTLLVDLAWPLAERQEYFADGIVEDIITALSRFRQLFVVARNSSFTYKGRAVDVKQVGRELGVRYVLEGSVRKAANRVRITGQLIDVSWGTSLGGSFRWRDRGHLRPAGSGDRQRRRRHCSEAGAGGDRAGAPQAI